MNIVLLSGGSGKRLWPLSNETRSKQFLKLLQDEQGNYESMVQRVYKQIRGAGVGGDVVIATSVTQVDSIRNQLGEQVDIVLEPERRNTFPAIALSCAFLYYQKKMAPDDVVVVLPVDPYAEIEYFHTLKKLETAVRSGAGELVLMGVKPTYPSAKYGYIIPAEQPMDSAWRPVSCFKEKPTEQQAEELIRQGALWNCGVFAFRLQFVLDILASQISADSYESVLAQYASLHKNSFDYEVVEHCRSIAVVGYQGVWNDLGTWNTLTEQMPSPAIGEVVLDKTTTGTHAINELDIPMVVMGAQNMVIVASYDGILVADKGQSSYLKPFVEQISQRPMFVERCWGDYRVIDYGFHEDGTKYLVKKILIRAGKSISYQLHHLRSEHWTVTSGEGIVLLNGESLPIHTGESITISAQTKHALRAVTDLQVVEVQMGSVLEEEDIERFEMEW